MTNYNGLAANRLKNGQYGLGSKLSRVSESGLANGHGEIKTASVVLIPEEDI
jgi:hypothetical protein